MTAPCSLRRLAWRWQRCFFRPADTLPCDVVRIGYASVLLVGLLAGLSQTRMWFGETGVLPSEAWQTLPGRNAWTLFTLLPRTDATAWVCYALWIAQTALLLVGVLPRFQAVCVYVWLLSFQRRNPLILDAEDGVLRVLGFLVLLMPLGYTLSWPAWRRGALCPRVERPLWALRLVQLEACLAFAGSALSKLQSADWLDGDAMYYVSRLDDLFGRFPTPAFLWESRWALALVGWTVIAIEAAVPIFVWFREARWLALAAAAVLHLATDYSMNLYMFHWIMLVTWSSFIEGDQWRALGGRVGRLARARPPAAHGLASCVGPLTHD